MMIDAGINARAIAGQWAHNYPDQPDRHSELTSGYGEEAYPNMSRMDWGVELFGWFNYYLKDIGQEPEPMVQIQTNDGKWHVEDTCRQKIWHGTFKTCLHYGLKLVIL